MARRFRAPQEKKQLSYNKDHRVAAEIHERFSQRWKKAKRIAQHKERHRVGKLLAQLVYEPEDKQALFPIKPVRRNTRRKSGVYTLQNWIKQHQMARALRFLNRTRNKNYRPSVDRDASIAAFNTVIQAQNAYWYPLANHLAVVLRIIPEPINPGITPTNYYNWLHAFFADDPACAERVRVWAIAILNQYGWGNEENRV